MDDSKGKYKSQLWQEKLVAEFAHISIFDAEELYIEDFLLILREAVIYNNSQSKSGIDYLEKCWILEQTKPERDKLREKFASKSKE